MLKFEEEETHSGMPTLWALCNILARKLEEHEKEKSHLYDEARAKVEMEDMVTYLKHKQGKYMNYICVELKCQLKTQFNITS